MGNCFTRCREQPERYATMVASESVSAEPPGGFDDIQEQIYGNDSEAFAREEGGEEEEEEALEFISHPFLIDETIVSALRMMKMMFIMRGMPGSGKSTVCAVLQRRYPSAVVCSADHFWLTPEGEYRFDASRLKEAHNACQNAAYRACQSGEPQVIIDNTNVRRWEFKFYTDLASRFGYLVIFAEPETPWRFDAELLASKGRHAVPLHVIEAKIKSFEPPPVPVYFGWFLMPSCCRELLGRAHAALAALQASEAALSRCELARGISLADFFSWHDRFLHVTAKFCDRGRLPGTGEYVARARRDLCRVFQLRVYALVITRRVIGAAVGPLEGEVPALWENGDEEDLPSGAKAHVTLATAPEVRPVQTGADLVLLLRRLQEGRMERLCDWSTGELWCSAEPGEGALLQLKQPLWLDTVFGQFL